MARSARRIMNAANGTVLACTIGNAVGVTPMVYAVFSLFLIPIATDFDWPRSSVSLVLLIIAIASATCYPMIGRLIDKQGARRVLLAGNVLFATSLAMVSIAPASYLLFYSAFALVGISAAIPSSVMFTKVIAGWFDKHRGLALGIAGGAGNGIGAALTPILVGALLTMGTWRTAYQGLALTIFLVGFPALWLLLRDPPNAKLTEDNQGDGMTLVQARRTSTFWWVLLAIGLGAGCLTAVFAHVIPILVEREVPMDQAIAVLATFSLVTAVWQVGVGFVLDRFSKPWIAAPFYVFALIGLWLLTTSSSHTMLLLGGVLMGLGLGTEYGVLPYFLSRYFGVRHYGSISGAVYAVIVLLQGFTPFLMDVNYDLAGSYNIALAVVAGALALGAAIIIRLPAFSRSHSVS